MSEWNWIQKLEELNRSGEECVLVTVTKVSGSTPREVGAKMIVTSSGEFFGTIGGGQLEALILSDARKKVAGVFSYPLGPAAGQCCGGLVEVFMDVIGSRPKLVIFGSGHVGIAVAQVFEGTPFLVTVVDEREEWLEKLPTSTLREKSWRKAAEEITEQTHAVVMTHSHDLDAEIVSVLAKKSLASLGLIGSESKWQRFQHKLEKMGLTESEIETIKCPIGIGDLGKHPKAIAVSLAAELFQKVKECTIPSSYLQRANLSELELQNH